MYIELPNISPGTPETELEQIRSYIYRLNEQLNIAFGDLHEKEKGYTGTIITHTGETLVFENGRLKERK